MEWKTGTSGKIMGSMGKDCDTQKHRGWGLNNIFLFAQALAAKGGWRLINTTSLWTQVITHKYIVSDSLEEWIRSPIKSHSRGSLIWKAVIRSFSVIEAHLAWNVGNGRKVRIGVDPGQEASNSIFSLLILLLH